MKYNIRGCMGTLEIDTAAIEVQLKKLIEEKKDIIKSLEWSGYGTYHPCRRLSYVTRIYLYGESLGGYRRLVENLMYQFSENYYQSANKQYDKLIAQIGDNKQYLASEYHLKGRFIKQAKKPYEEMCKSAIASCVDEIAYNVMTEYTKKEG